MYEVYSTEAFVLRSISKKELDQDVLLFTRDFGLIKATVSSSKNDFSKHKGIVQDFSFIKVFLIISNAGYRITGGEFLNNIFFIEDDDRILKTKIIKNIFSLFEKMLLKNVLDENIFLSFKIFYLNLIKSNNDLKEKEIYFIIEMLSEMGYLDREGFLKEAKGKNDKIDYLVKKINLLIKDIDFN